MNLLCLMIKYQTTSSFRVKMDPKDTTLDTILKCRNLTIKQKCSLVSKIMLSRTNILIKIPDLLLYRQHNPNLRNILSTKQLIPSQLTLTPITNQIMNLRYPKPIPTPKSANQCHQVAAPKTSTSWKTTPKMPARSYLPRSRNLRQIKVDMGQLRRSHLTTAEISIC